MERQALHITLKWCFVALISPTTCFVLVGALGPCRFMKGVDALKAGLWAPGHAAKQFSVRGTAAPYRTKKPTVLAACMCRDAGILVSIIKALTMPRVVA